MSKAKRIQSSTEAIRSVRYRIKGTLLYLLPFPLLVGAIISLFMGRPLSAILLGITYSAYIVTAILARKGLKNEQTYHNSPLAQAPKIPFKSISALILSVTTGTTALLVANYSLMSSLLLAAVSFLGFYFSYGLDPRKDKGTNIFGVSGEEVMEALAAAEIKLSAIEVAKDQIQDLNIKKQLRTIISEARGILKTIEHDPKDLEPARKFLTVHLDGAKRVTESYLKTHSNNATTDSQESDFSRVLYSIENNFKSQHDKLKNNDRFDLDVQIEVVETQIKHDK